MAQSASKPVGVGAEEDLQLRLRGLQHEVEKSAGLVRRLAILAILLVVLLIVLLISLRLYDILQYASVESVGASSQAGHLGEAEIRYRPTSAGKIMFIRESEGLVQTLTEYVESGNADRKEVRFTWSGKPGENSTIRVTYRDGLSRINKELPVGPPGFRP